MNSHTSKPLSKNHKISRRPQSIHRFGSTHRVFICGLAALFIVGLVGITSCNKQKTHKEFTTNKVLLLDGFQTPELGTKVYTSDDEFKVDTVYTKDGDFLVTVDHFTYPQTRYDRLFSSDGKLLIGLSGCQECAISGYAVIYDEDNVENDNAVNDNAVNDNAVNDNAVNVTSKVKGVIRTGTFDDAYPEFIGYKQDSEAFAKILKEWYQQLKDNTNDIDFEVCYNNVGIPYDVKGLVNIENSIEGPIEFGIYEGDDFWVSDLHGGELSFLTLFKDLDEDLSGEGLLYYEEYPCARLTFERGKVVKYTTYDRNGNILTENDHPDGDIVGRILLEIEWDW